MSATTGGRKRVLVAPDKFAGTLSAVEAAQAIGLGWQRTRPDDILMLQPMSDGGPGFLGVLAHALGGALESVEVPDPLGNAVSADILSTSDNTIYLESAQAIGLALTPSDQRDPERASTIGLGTLLLEAIARHPTRIVIGLGGTATNDGGAGLLAALGATCVGATLTQGPSGLSGISALDLSAARARVAGVDLVAATDVDSVLTGLFGATKTYGAQKGLAAERLPVVDGWLQELAAVSDSVLATKPGTGAGGGVGFALQLLGARRVSGFDVVADAIELAEAVTRADVVVTGEGAFDFSSRAGKVPYGVAQVAAAGLRPCIALAGQVLIGSREMRALGIESAYSMVDLVGEEHAFAEPAEALATLAQRVARTWGGRP